MLKKQYRFKIKSKTTKSILTIKQELLENGYSIIPDILSKKDLDYCKSMFIEWQQTIPNHDYIHKSVNPHGIYKFHNVGHTRHAWYIRTRPSIQNIFKQLWNTDELIVSFDGCCYIPKNCDSKDKYWTHSDQAPTKKGLQCYQGFVTLTDNKQRTLIVYEKSHLYHKQYFIEKNIDNSKNWNLIDIETLGRMQSSRRVLHIPAGALVLWDSRTFHQNQYGKPNSEERMVQYVCYLPKSHIKNTEKIRKKRLKYYNDRRTTSHWPAPIYVNGKQPQTYGDSSRSIDYSLLQPSILDDLEEDIMKLI